MVNKKKNTNYGKIKWNYNNLNNRDCPFCRSRSNFAFTRPDNLKIKYCNICGSFFVSPSPKEKELNDFYINYFSSHRTVELNQYFAKSILSIDPLSDVRVREIISNILPNGKKLLDVGCGYGQSLIYFKKLGADVEGIDLDLKAIEFIKNELHINSVENCSIEDVDGNYDMILMNDFIEHPLDPLSKLMKAKELLNKRGILAIWTPNASFVFEEDNPLIFKVDLEHMQYLSSKTCIYLSKLLELDIIHLESLGFPDLGVFKKNKFLEYGDLISKVINNPSMFKIFNNIRKSVTSNPEDNMRDGQYHLFCLLQNP